MSPLIQKTLKSVLKQDISVAYQVYQPWLNDYEEITNGSAFSTPQEPIRPQARPSQTGNLNSKYTFATFVVGKPNRFAHAAAMAVAENPGYAFNPLVLHAGVGLGKTHLLHAIGHAARSKGLQYLYVSAEQYTNDFVTALRENSLEAFRGKYRSLDLLLVDDIQFIAGKEHSRESFFHTFNDLHTSSKQIVITSDTRPKSIPLLEERLRSRLEGGLIADIQTPDLETRMAILGKKAEAAHISLRPDVVEFIARKIVRNVRELEGALNRILAMARLTRHPVDLELAEQAIADLATSSPRSRRVNPNQVVSDVATYYGLSPEDLMSKSRKKGIALARQVAAYLLREDTDRSLAEIGRILGGRGHTTALRAHDKVAYESNINAELRRQLGEIRDVLDQDQPRIQ